MQNKLEKLWAFSITFFLRENLLFMGAIFFILSISIYFFTDNINSKSLFSGVTYMHKAIEYIVSIEFLKVSLENRMLLKNISYRSCEFTHYQNQILGMFAAVPFGLGVSSFLKGISKEQIDIKPISEGMTASMLIYPSTLGSSFIFDYLGIESLTSTFIFGVALIFFLFFSKSYSGIQQLLTNKLFLVILLLCSFNIAYLIIISYFFST